MSPDEHNALPPLPLQVQHPYEIALHEAFRERDDQAATAHRWMKECGDVWHKLHAERAEHEERIQQIRDEHAAALALERETRARLAGQVAAAQEMLVRLEKPATDGLAALGRALDFLAEIRTRVGTPSWTGLVVRSARKRPGLLAGLAEDLQEARRLIFGAGDLISKARPGTWAELPERVRAFLSAPPTKGD